MALKPCSECGHQVSTKAVSCPSCGNPNEKEQPATSEQQSPRSTPRYHGQLSSNCDHCQDLTPGKALSNVEWRCSDCGNVTIRPRRHRGIYPAGGFRRPIAEHEMNLPYMAITEADLLEILERDDLTKAERSKWRTELKRIREELRRGHERQQEQVQRDREHRRDGGWAVEKKRRGRAGRLRPFK